MDVTQDTFQSAVIERSRELPVVVDFWAAWCAPCRQLGPVIERAIAARAGKVELVKVDVDSNQRLAIDYRVQGIPAVKAFKDGRVVAEFTGAQPPAAVERFLDSLLPTEADLLVARGDEQSLRRALELEPMRADAAVPLARLLNARGERDSALNVLARVPRDFAADGLTARIELETAPETDPSPVPTAELREAFGALDRGDVEHALELLLAMLPNADGFKDGLRRVIIGALDEFSVDDQLARDARRRLAAALY
ncbi:MAG: tetratricopeptide repeat protein [Solirubrobacteraceae bacterium]